MIPWYLELALTERGKTARLENNLKDEVRGQELSFGDVKFEMLTKYPRRDIAQVFGYQDQECREQTYLEIYIREGSMQIMLKP